MRNSATGKVQSFGYNDAGALQSIVGDTNSVVIDATGNTSPIAGNLGGIANLNHQTITTTTATNHTYAFNLQQSELNTTNSHNLLIAVEGAGTSQIDGIAPIYTKGNYRIFAIDTAGINLLELTNSLAQATAYQLTIIGDLNNDGKVDGVDSQLLTNAFTQPYNLQYDLDRDDKIDSLDLQLLGSNYGFIAAAQTTSTTRPTKIGTVTKTPTSITLVEGTGLLTQMTTAIHIDNTPGQQQLISFDLNPSFNLTDKTGVIEDQFAVYLVDPTTRKTILDRGESGTSLGASHFLFD